MLEFNCMRKNVQVTSIENPPVTNEPEQSRWHVKSISRSRFEGTKAMSKYTTTGREIAKAKVSRDTFTYRATDAATRLYGGGPNREHRFSLVLPHKCDIRSLLTHCPLVYQLSAK